jgi:hypothetical protein
MKKQSELVVAQATAVAAASVQTLLHNGSWRWLYAERMETTELCFLADVLNEESGVPWSRWPYGRAFDEHSELAWQRRPDGNYDLCWLAEGGAPPAGISWTTSPGWQASDPPVETLLHGSLDRGRSSQEPQRRASWSEARIPRYLYHPVASSGDDLPERVTLVTQAYAQQGIVGLTRLLAVR